MLPLKHLGSVRFFKFYEISLTEALFIWSKIQYNIVRNYHHLKQLFHVNIFQFISVMENSFLAAITPVFMILQQSTHLVLNIYFLLFSMLKQLCWIMFKMYKHLLEI